MKIPLFILGVITAVLLLLLILPVTVCILYKERLVLKIKISGITIFDSTKKKKAKTKEETGDTKKSQKKQKEGFVKKVYKEKGLLDTVKYFCELLGLALKKLLWLVKRFKFRKVRLDLTIATDDAANTALQYGGICCAVYPLIAFLQTNADFKADSINISTDFDKSSSEISFEFSIATRVAFLIIAVLSALFKYLKLQRKECEKI